MRHFHSVPHRLYILPKVEWDGMSTKERLRRCKEEKLLLDCLYFEFVDIRMYRPTTPPWKTRFPKDEYAIACAIVARHLTQISWQTIPERSFEFIAEAQLPSDEEV